MRKTDRAPFSDDEALMALHFCEAEGLSRAGAAVRLNALFGNGRSRNSVVGLLNRINADTDKVPCRCLRPENRDGGMPSLWWFKEGAA